MDSWSLFTSSKIDTVVGHEYKLVQDLGHGSYGCLFLGQNVFNGQYAAIKLLSKQGLDATQLNIQRLEIDVQKSLNHPNIVALHSTFEDDDYLYIVLELCDQGDLFDFVVNDKQPNRDEDFVRNTYSQILCAVEYLHKNHVYHRDIKPENVLLQYDDENHTAICKLADFGLATTASHSTEYGCGSVNYLAPEHNDESQPYDCSAADVWSMGILLLAIMFGRNPWSEATEQDSIFKEYKKDPRILKELFTSLSDECYNYLTLMLCIDPLRRISIHEASQQFQFLTHLFVDDSPTPVSPEPIPSQPRSIPVPIKSSQAQPNSYDSGICCSSSWSDDLDDDCDFDANPFDDYPTTTKKNEPEDDLFVHGKEADSWWL